MHETLDSLEETFAESSSVDEAADLALDLIEGFGFSSLVYDYSPVAISSHGELITPSCISMRNVPDDMQDLWCNGGFYQLDPVQHLALASTVPFVWSYRRTQNSTLLARYLTEKHRPLVSYLHDANLTLGITIPIQHTRGDLATYTAICHDASKGFERDAAHNLATLSLIGQVFHKHVYSMFTDKQRQTTAFERLTPREQECLRYSAEGLSAKEIAYRLNRAIPTITQHLQTASNKLGARNRVHAVMLAQHYRLLEL